MDVRESEHDESSAAFRPLPAGLYSAGRHQSTPADEEPVLYPSEDRTDEPDFKGRVLQSERKARVCPPIDRFLHSEVSSTEE